MPRKVPHRRITGSSRPEARPLFGLRVRIEGNALLASLQEEPDEYGRAEHRRRRPGPRRVRPVDAVRVLPAVHGRESRRCASSTIPTSTGARRSPATRPSGTPSSRSRSPNERVGMEGDGRQGQRRRRDVPPPQRRLQPRDGSDRPRGRGRHGESRVRAAAPTRARLRTASERFKELVERASASQRRLARRGRRRRRQGLVIDDAPHTVPGSRPSVRLEPGSFGARLSEGTLYSTAGWQTRERRWPRRNSLGHTTMDARGLHAPGRVRS